MENVVYAVFLLTYALIATRRLAVLPIGRPAGALLGAVLMVAVGALSPAESYRAVDYDTILLLFSMMALAAYLERADFFRWLAGKVIAWCGTPWKMLWALCMLSGGLSAFLVNDTVCLFLTPVVLTACTRAGLPLGPYLIAIATSANIGSAATLVGNPQNMIIAGMSGISFSRFAARAAIPACAGLLINMGLLWIFYRRRIPEKLPPECGLVQDEVNLKLLSPVVVVISGVVAGFFAGFHLAYTTLAGVMVLVVMDRQDPRHVFSRIDWPLLVFFCCLFIVVAGLAKTGIIENAWQAGAPLFHFHSAGGLAYFTALMTLGSNLVSNVPMVLLTGPHIHSLGAGDTGWVLLAFTTTIAGNFTLIGSVANIIVAETARDNYNLGFGEYLRFGAISTAAVLVAGIALIRLGAHF